MPSLHGMAAKIRAAAESETFDLGGLPESTIQQIIQDAFGTDWSYDAIAASNNGNNIMIRITLVVGAGKQSRQKYSDSTPKVVAAALNAAGYEEDRGASCVPECGGLYKLQHDTGKNLKTVVVFPRFSQETIKTSGNKGSAGSNLLPPESSTEYKALVCSMVVFENILKYKVSSWFQKRNLTQYLEEDIIHGQLQECDALLLKGQVLSHDQQVFYDACVDINAKHAALKEAMHQQVEDEQLTEPERDFLLQQVAHRIEELEASNSNSSALAKARQRQSKLQSIAPIPLPSLKHHIAIAKLWKQAAPLLHLQTKQNQQHLTLAETKRLGQLEDILAEIGELEEDSQGWLEDDDVFEKRIQAYRRELQQKFGPMNNKNSGGTGKKSNQLHGSSSSSSITTSTKIPLPRVGSGAWMSTKDKKAQALQSKKNKLKKGDVFGAAAAVMMMDDEDDGESGSSDGEQENSGIVSSQSKFSYPTPGTTQSSSRYKKKSKGKKGGGIRANGDGDDDNAILDAVVSANQKALSGAQLKEREANKKRNADGGVLSTLLDILLPFLMAILTWLASLVLGSSSKSAKKRKKRS
jgi:hypothetical protein